MGNRAVITTPDRKLGLYLHWNGGRDTVEPLLRYCELKGYRDPAKDDYGWARMCHYAAENARPHLLASSQMTYRAA